MNTKFKNQMKLQPKLGVSFTYFSISSTRNDKLVRGFRDELGTEYVGSVPRLYRMHKLSTGVIPNINLHIKKKKKKILTFNTQVSTTEPLNKNQMLKWITIHTIIHSPPNL